jgi:hypothetical protein
MLVARLLLVLFGAVALAGCAPSLHAQAPWGGPRSSYGGGAYDEGYRRGELRGQDDARRGAPFDYVIVEDYRRADRGYRGQYGSRDRYRQEFRQGFQAGYQSGYSRFSRGGGYYGRRGPGAPTRGRGRGAYGSSSGYAFDLAAGNGYNDGYEAGLDDGRDGRRHDPTREGRYRSANSGYERSYGSRELYRSNYRRGFVDGYDTGYRLGLGYR